MKPAGADEALAGAKPSPGRRRAAFAQYIFLAAVVGFGGYWIYAHRAELAEAWASVEFWPVVGAMLFGMVGASTAVPIWRSVLAGMGSVLGWRSAARIVLIGQLGKYVPGGVWPVIVQARMAREEHVPVVRSGSASLMSLIISVITSLSLGAVALVLSGAAVLHDWWWVTLLVIPLLAVLHPTVIGWLGRLASAVLRRPIELPLLTLGSVLRAAAWALVGQVIFGLQYYLLLGMVSGDWHDPLLAIGLFQLATSAGILVVFAAAGAGPRELILVAGSAAAVGQGPALLAVLLSRAVLTVGDFLLAGIGWLLGRSHRREKAQLNLAAPASDAADGSEPA